MFLIGGPAFSGTTLLAFLLNQGRIVCLDEPDFHNPLQSHRGIPFLKSLFPDCDLPESPRSHLSHLEAFEFIWQCERLIPVDHLGIKTCDHLFILYSEIYRQRGLPIVAIFRDIRDALVRRLPGWVTESSLNRNYREVWQHRNDFDTWVKYEDLVTDPNGTIKKVARALGIPFQSKLSWQIAEVHYPMFKLDRHELLRSGRVSSHRIGIWRSSGQRFSHEITETAHEMGYGD
jgi:hypothetical protein